MYATTILMLATAAAGVAFGVVYTQRAQRRHLAKVRAAERRARAAERMAEIGAMTGGLAHEIKNPLSTIGLNAQLLGEAVDDLAIEPEHKSRLVNRVRALRREVDRLRGILTDFLDYAGQVRLDRRPTDLNTLLDELAEFYRPEADRLGVRIRLELHPAPLIASVDAKLVKQALLNLMINAVQAMAGPSAAGAVTPAPPGSAGELILRTAPVTPPAAHGHAPRRPPKPAVDDEPAVRIDVIDTGPGMSDDVRARVFTPYFTTKAGGTGLGLPTTRRLIEEHGGRIDLLSEQGKGTAFTVVLPVSPATAPAPGVADADHLAKRP